MTPTVAIELTPAAQAALQKLDKFPARLMSALREGMDYQNQLTVSHIQAKYLSFSKSSKPTLAGLRVITNRLRSSIRASKATISGDSIESAIGSNVSYARLHEFGGDVTRVTKAGSVRLRTDAHGQLLRQGKNGKLAVFAKNTHKRAAVVSYAGGKRYTVHYPARAPIQRGIKDQLPNYKTILSGKVITAFNA